MLTKAAPPSGGAALYHQSDVGKAMLEPVLAGDSTTGRQYVNSELVLSARMEVWL